VSTGTDRGMGFGVDAPDVEGGVKAGEMRDGGGSGAFEWGSTSLPACRGPSWERLKSKDWRLGDCACGEYMGLNAGEACAGRSGMVVAITRTRTRTRRA
jgi:hypothetical protein